MNKISNYDEFDYDYKSYWESRDYEDRAEKLVLERYLAGIKTPFFLDIGGSFGRNLEAYCPLCETPIILDYSIKTLQKNKASIKKKCPKTELLAANAYYLPFKEEAIGASMMIRVLHHIENQKGLFEEIDRVTKKGGFFILEYANKIHLKARLKWLIKGKFHNFSTSPYQQPSQGNFEGATEGEDAIFLNYHPRFIKKLLEKNGFKVLKSTNCSFFRIGILKRFVPIAILMFFEKLSQTFFSWKNIAPSIIVKAKKETEGIEKKEYKNFEEILCCPKCKGDLKIEKNKALCKQCNKIYKQEDGIWDFRV
jgi:ubiquinone/menaquinone biosynthesis C-methylase UbiE